MKRNYYIVIVAVFLAMVLGIGIIYAGCTAGRQKYPDPTDTTERNSITAEGDDGQPTEGTLPQEEPTQEASDEITDETDEATQNDATDETDATEEGTVADPEETTKNSVTEEGTTQDVQDAESEPAPDEGTAPPDETVVEDESDAPVDYPTYEEFYAMTSQEQQDFYNSFGDPAKFAQWFEEAKADYEERHPGVEIGPGGIIP